jgi:hypothetical protein
VPHAQRGTAVPLVEQLAASAATPGSRLFPPGRSSSPLDASRQARRPTATGQLAFALRPALPSLPFFFLLSSAQHCLALACFRIASFSFVCSLVFYSPWPSGTGGFTAATSRSHSLQFLCSPRPSKTFPRLPRPPWATLVPGARWLAPPHGRGRPFSRYDVTHAD